MGIVSAFRPPIVGLDLGSYAVKAVAIRQGRKGWSLQAAGELAMPFGEEPTPEEVTETAATLLDTLGLRRARVVAALSGQSVIVKRLVLPPMRDEALAEAMPREAEQYLPYALSDVQLDYQVLVGAAALPAGALDVLMVAARRDRVTDRLGPISQTGRAPVVLDVEACALANGYQMSYPEHGDGLVVLLHVGSGSTVVCVLEDGLLAFTRDISMGGSTYVDALERELGLDHTRAQRALRGNHDADDDGSGVADVRRDVHDRLVLEVRKTLDFYWSTAKPAALDRLVLSGGACQIVGLDLALADQFQVVAEQCDPFRNINRRQLDVEGPVYAIAVGLALRAGVDR